MRVCMRVGVCVWVWAVSYLSRIDACGDLGVDALEDLGPAPRRRGCNDGLVRPIIRHHAECRPRVSRVPRGLAPSPSTSPSTSPSLSLSLPLSLFPPDLWDGNVGRGGDDLTVVADRLAQGNRRAEDGNGMVPLREDVPVVVPLGIEAHLAHTHELGALDSLLGHAPQTRLAPNPSSPPTARTTPNTPNTPTTRFGGRFGGSALALDARRRRHRGVPAALRSRRL